MNGEVDLDQYLQMVNFYNTEQNNPNNAIDTAQMQMGYAAQNEDYK